MTKILIVEAGQSNAIDLGVAASATNYPGIVALFADVTIIDYNSGAQNPPQFVEDGPRGLSARTKIVASQPIGTGVAALVTGRILNRVKPLQVVILRMALDSSGLEDNWLNPSFPSSGDQWMEQFFDRIEATEIAHDCLFDILNWKQGEHDANGSPDATNYLANLRTLRDLTRARFNRQIGFAIGGLSTLFTAGSAGLIRTAQAAFVAETSRSILVDPAGCPFQDTAHYSNKGYAMLGHRFGLADRALIPNLNSTPFDIEIGSDGGGGGFPSFPALTNATTADAIRDRALDAVEAITPTYIPGTRFRRYRNEGDGDFPEWAEQNPADAFRRLQVRFDGTERTPAVSNSDHEERLVRLTTTIAYPHNARTGNRQALDRDTAIDRDYDQLERAIGLYSRPNFSPVTDPTYPDACWVEGDCVRLQGSACDFLVVTSVFSFRRSLS